MFGAVPALLNSEKAVALGLLIVAASAMVFLDRMSVETWVDYTEVLAGLYIGGKTVQGTVAAFTARRAPPADEGKPGPT